MLELGVAFYQWSLDKVGEEVGRWWTQQEEKKFKVKSNPTSLDRYYNIERRAFQNRHTPDNIDSDD
ncbi:AT-rich interactive domain-containing protein 1-like, partial [Trifolium medium]|nr:AT-rich interactive domain-containing protein 1-like [Trifolium medium]